MSRVSIGAVLSPAPGVPTPTLVQHQSSAMNALAKTNCAGNNYKIRLLQPVLSGNCLILGITHGGTAPTGVSDNINGAWAAATVTANAGSYDSRIYVMPNAGGGQTTVTVAFSGTQDPFQYEASEFYNVATTSPGAGSVATADDTGAALACGSFTPTNNDATGGNLLWSYFCLSAIANESTYPSSISPGTSHTLLSADRSQDTLAYHACQYYVQPTSASINPGMTFTGETGNTFNCLAVALKAASAGTAPAASGIRIKSQANHSWWRRVPSQSVTLQFPCTGNLIALMINEPGVVEITSVTDSNGNSYTKRQGSETGAPQCWHTANSTPSTNLVITMNMTSHASTQRYTVMAYDIVGAAASPYDNAASVYATCDGATYVDNHPSLTPTYSTGLTLALLSLGLGPATGFHTGYPSGAIFHACTYDGMTDADYLNNAAGQAHLYHSSTAQQNWNWAITNQTSNTAMSLAVAFKGA